jgi:Nucleotidyl transferase AbiEii toxin, Type IV TA system
MWRGASPCYLARHFFTVHGSGGPDQARRHHSDFMRKARSKAATLPPITPKLDTLPAAQQRLWPELTHTPPEFFLAGGTGIAIQLGHRHSQDFDFFALEPIDPARLLRSIPYLNGATVLDEDANTLTVSVMRKGAVKLSFFGVPRLRLVAKPRRIEGTTLKVANLIDLAGFKMAVVYQRQDPKDYLDVDAILSKTDIRLTDALAAAHRIYGTQFNAMISLKALGHFNDPQLAALQAGVRRRLLAAIGAVRYKDMATTLKAADLSPR